MNSFKKLLALVLCLLTVFSLVACGADEPAASNGGQTPGNAPAEGEAPAYVTEPRMMSVQVKMPSSQA